MPRESTIEREPDAAHPGDGSRSRLTILANRYAGMTRWVSIALIVLSLLLFASALPIDRVAPALQSWVDSLGVWGPLVLGILYVLATVLMFPGFVLTLVAGALFGFVVGLVTVSLASTTGAALAFVIGRYFAREKVAEIARKRPKFRAIDQAVAEGGWRIVALLRLSPVVPFNLQNYFFGLTRIRFWPYVLTSWLAMLPGTFVYVYIGSILGVAIGQEREMTTAEWVLYGVGLLATVAVVVYITRLARRKLQAETAISEQEDKGASMSDQQQTPEQTEPGAPPRWPWGTSILALLALVFLGCATCTAIKPGAVQGLFGPPEVEMKEAYEARTGGPEFDHTEFTRILEKHVDTDGWVNYKALQQDRQALENYIDRIAKAPFDEMGRDEKLALLINAYNAFTLKLILEYYPLDSIKDIPEEKRWEDERWTIGGRTWSLNQIEHEQIRPKFKEPRIHFALVCAAVGCPPLRQDAYVPQRLDDQLEERARYVHNHDTWFRHDTADNTVHLTPLYQWYGDDFRQVAGSVLEYVARYAPQVKAALEQGDEPEIAWLDYKWALNSVENRRPR